MYRISKKKIIRLTLSYIIHQWNNNTKSEVVEFFPSTLLYFFLSFVSYWILHYACSLPYNNCRYINRSFIPLCEWQHKNYLWKISKVCYKNIKSKLAGDENQIKIQKVVYNNFENCLCGNEREFLNSRVKKKIILRKFNRSYIVSSHHHRCVSVYMYALYKMWCPCLTKKKMFLIHQFIQHITLVCVWWCRHHTKM